MACLLPLETATLPLLQLITALLFLPSIVLSVLISSERIPACTPHVQSSFSTMLTLNIQPIPLHNVLAHIPPHFALFLFLTSPRHPTSLKRVRHSRAAVAFLFCQTKPTFLFHSALLFFQFFSPCSAILSYFYSLCITLLLINILSTFSFIKPSRAPIFLYAS